MHCRVYCMCAVGFLWLSFVLGYENSHAALHRRLHRLQAIHFDFESSLDLVFLWLCPFLPHEHIYYLYMRIVSLTC